MEFLPQINHSTDFQILISPVL